jgi:hypothetical protein
MSGNRERLIDFFTPARKAKTIDVEFFCLIVRLKTGAGSTSGNIYLTIEALRVQLLDHSTIFDNSIQLVRTKTCPLNATPSGCVLD